MKYLITPLIIFLGAFASAQMNLNKETGIPRGQICEMPWDTFEWIQPDPSVSEYSLSCLNSEVLKIYTYDEGVLKFRESISKKSVRAFFYEDVVKRKISPGPEVKFYLGRSSACKDKLALNAALLWRTGGKFVQLSTGICTQVPASELSKDEKFLRTAIADVAAFEDYDHATYLLGLTLRQTDLAVVRVNFAEDKYEQMEKTHFKLVSYIPSKVMTESLENNFNCGKILTGARFLENSTKILLGWLENLTVFDYAGHQPSHEVFYHNLTPAPCAAVDYGFGGYESFRSVFISATEKKLLYVKPVTLKTNTMKY